MRNIFIPVLFLVISGCGRKEAGPFTTGSRFSYATSYTSPDGRITRYDTLDLTIGEKDITNYKNGVKKVKWENTRHDYYQVRSIDVGEDKVELQLPLNYRGFDHERIAIAGHPTVMLNAEPDHTLTEMKEYKGAYGALNGKIISQRTQYLRDTSIDFDGTMLPCELYIKYNSSHKDPLGQYKAIYTYNASYGFVTMNYYYPDNKHISMRLVDVALNRP
jgi:hypothetical protein